MTDNLWEYCNDCNECFKTVINGVSPVYFNKKCSKCGKLGWFDAKLGQQLGDMEGK